MGATATVESTYDNDEVKNSNTLNNTTLEANNVLTLNMQSCDDLKNPSQTIQKPTQDQETYDDDLKNAHIKETPVLNEIRDETYASEKMPNNRDNEQQQSVTDVTVRSTVESRPSMFLKLANLNGPDQKAKLLFGGSTGIGQRSPRIAKPLDLPSFREKEGKVTQLDVNNTILTPTLAERDENFKQQIKILEGLKKLSEASFQPYQSRSKSTIIPQVQLEKLNRAESYQKYFKEALRGQHTEQMKIEEKQNMLDRLKDYHAILLNDLEQLQEESPDKRKS